MKTDGLADAQEERKVDHTVGGLRDNLGYPQPEERSISQYCSERTFRRLITRMTRDLRIVESETVFGFRERCWIALVTQTRASRSLTSIVTDSASISLSDWLPRET